MSKPSAQSKANPRNQANRATVFLSWSGNLARRLAETFERRIPILTGAGCFFSPVSIGPGKEWRKVLDRSLRRVGSPTPKPTGGGAFCMGPSGGFSYGFGMLVSGTVGADHSLGAGGCSLLVHEAAPYIVLPVQLNFAGGLCIGVGNTPSLTDTWLYVQYLGADPGAPLGLHASNGLAIHYSQ